MTAVRILYKDVDIAPDVQFSTARFMANANGVPGEMYLRVRDKEHAYPPGYFHTGGTLQLELDGRVEWDGWVMAVDREYAFAVDNTEDPQETPRWWVLTGSDRNLLFLRRVHFDLTDPTNMDWGIYQQGETDQAVVRDLLANYLDLEGDGLDIFSGIEEVGPIDPYQDIRVAAVGMPWERSMKFVGGQNGAISYIDPDRIVRYVDDETVTAPFGLSDQPGEGQVGYREVMVRSLGSTLVNDYLGWGAGIGSREMVFARVEDATSIAEHGLFQKGEYNEQMWRQESLDRRADTYINGSPSHKRGHKDPRDEVIAVLYMPGLRVSNVVDFRCNAFDYQDNLPVRSIEMTFPTPTSVKFRVKLGHEIDIPWAFRDPWFTTGIVDEWDSFRLDGGRGDGGELELLGPGYSSENDFFGVIGVGGAAHKYQDGSGDAWFGTLGSWVKVVVDEVSSDASGVQIYIPGVMLWYDLHYFTESLQSPLDYLLLAEGHHGYFERRLDIYVSHVEPTPPYNQPEGNLAGSLSVVEFGRVPIEQDPTNNLVYVYFPTPVRSYRGLLRQGDNWILLWPTADVPTISAPSPPPPPPEITGTGQVNGLAIPAGPPFDAPRAIVAEIYRGGGLSHTGTTEPAVSWVMMPGGSFQTQYAYVPGSLEVYFQGQRMVRGVDYVESDPSSGTFTLIGNIDNLSGELTVRYRRVAMFAPPPALDDSALEAFMARIAWVESRGCGVYTCQNKHTGAYGKYQFMPNNWKVWGPRYLNTNPDDAYAHGSVDGALWQPPTTPGNQEIVARGRISAFFRLLGDWRRVACVWRSGGRPAVRQPGETYVDENGQTKYYWTEGSLHYVNSVCHTLGFPPVTRDTILPPVGTSEVYTPPGGGDPNDPNSGDYYNVPAGTGRIYRPRPQRQFGWGTKYDSVNCNFASAAMCLDRHTLGAHSDVRGTPLSTPPAHRRYSGVTAVAGTGMNDAVRAWRNGWGQSLNWTGYVSWAYFVNQINSGRGAILFGKYSHMAAPYKFSATYNGGHAIYINEQLPNGSFYGVDPIRKYGITYPFHVLRTYAQSWTGSDKVAASFSRQTPRV
jgi:hypothetical protein